MVTGITDAHKVQTASLAARVDVTDVAIATTVGDDRARDAITLVAAAALAPVAFGSDVIATVGVRVAVVHLVALSL